MIFLLPIFAGLAATLAEMRIRDKHKFGLAMHVIGFVFGASVALLK